MKHSHLNKILDKNCGNKVQFVSLKLRPFPWKFISFHWLFGRTRLVNPPEAEFFSWENRVLVLLYFLFAPNSQVDLMLRLFYKTASLSCYRITELLDMKFDAFPSDYYLQPMPLFPFIPHPNSVAGTSPHSVIVLVLPSLTCPHHKPASLTSFLPKASSPALGFFWLWVSIAFL